MWQADTSKENVTKYINTITMFVSNSVTTAGVGEQIFDVVIVEVPVLSRGCVRSILESS